MTSRIFIQLQIAILLNFFHLLHIFSFSMVLPISKSIVFFFLLILLSILKSIKPLILCLLLLLFVLFLILWIVILLKAIFNILFTVRKYIRVLSTSHSDIMNRRYRSSLNKSIKIVLVLIVVLVVILDAMWNFFVVFAGFLGHYWL